MLISTFSGLAIKYLTVSLNNLFDVERLPKKKSITSLISA